MKLRLECARQGASVKDFVFFALMGALQTGSQTRFNKVAMLKLHSHRRAFTLVEILVVLAVIGILTALLFPAFNRVRRRSYQTSCSSNLKQLGLAVALYQGDYDGLFPRGGDPTDLKTDAWRDTTDGDYRAEISQLPPLTYVLRPYVKSAELWHCPADDGFDVADMSQQILDARPSSFAKFGMSYEYRTELTLKSKKELLGYDKSDPPVEYGPSDINVLADGHGSWHGENEPRELRRYNVLMGDGRVVNYDRKQLTNAWLLRLDLPVSNSKN